MVNSNNVRALETAGGFCCLVAGFVAASVGSLLTASAWFVGVPLHPWLHAVGTALLIAAIPLMLFAGFCLDWAENDEQKPLAHPERSQRGTAAVVQVVISTTILAAALLAPNALRVPTTDVLARGKVYAELDFSFKPTDSTAVNKFTSLVPPVVVGAGNRVEIGLNILGNNLGSGLDTHLAPAAAEFQFTRVACAQSLPWMQ